MEKGTEFEKGLPATTTKGTEQTPRPKAKIGLLESSLVFFAIFGLVFFLVGDVAKLGNAFLRLQPWRGQNGAPSGYTVGWDHRALTINGERKLFVSGSIHYPRSTPSQWPGILQRTKAAGVDVVTTYVFWDLHEQQRGVFNFEGRADLVRFLKECQKAGLYVNLRIGPYVCAEWHLGGFPNWLTQVPGIVFRTYNEPYMAEMQRWTTYVVDLMKQHGMFAPQGGPIIMAQIENEYGDLGKAYGEEAGTKYIQWSADMATALDIGVPWIMCQQDNAPASVLHTCNGFYCDGWYPKRNIPKMWTENWPGWFQKWPEAFPKRPTEDVAFSMARFYARGGSYANYYMWHGGTNFERTAAEGLTTSYDYDVALNEFGMPHEPKYSHSARLHDVLHKYESIIMGVDKAPDSISLGPKQEGHNYTTKDGSVYFLSNIDDKNPVNVTWGGRTYTLAAWSVSIVDASGNVVYDTATIGRPTTPAVNTQSVTLNTEWEYAMDHVGVWGTPTTSDRPIELISLTIDSTDYLWYETTVTHASGPGQLTLHNASDVIYVYVDGTYNGWANTMCKGKDITIDLNFDRDGSHMLSILAVKMGIPNYGAYMEKKMHGGLCGIVSLDGNDITQGTWHHQVGLQGEDQGLFTESGQKRVEWHAGIPTRPLVWMRTTFTSPAGAGSMAVNLGAFGKGQVWVNGNQLGRFWALTPCQGPCDQTCDYRGSFNDKKCRGSCSALTQQYYHIPRDWMVADGGVNALVILEEQLLGQPPATIEAVVYPA